MKTTPEEIALFDRYERNEMNIDERSLFEENLKNDPELSAKHDSFKTLEQALGDNEIIQFKAQLKNWDKTDQPKKNTKIFPLKFVAIAASILVLIGVGMTYFFNLPTNSSLVADNFQPYDNVLTIRGEKEDIDDGLKHYEQKKYTEAIHQFNKYPDNENALFYLAESHMALKQYEEAVESYQLVLQFDNLFKEVSSFHLALAYIGLENTEDAIKMLNSIPKDSDYAALALDLLEDLK